MPSYLENLVNAASREGSAAFGKGMEGGNEQQLARLKDYLQGKAQQREAELAKELQPSGGMAKVGGVEVSETGAGRLQNNQVQHLQQIIDQKYKPITDAINASKGTLSSLALGTDAGDKAALLNEAALLSKGSGGHAVGQFLSALTGDPTLASNATKLANYITAGGISKLTDAQRQNLRQLVGSRLDDTQAQHEQVQKLLMSQGSRLAPNADYAGMLKPYADMTSEGLRASRALASPPAPPLPQAPGQVPEPSVLDKLKSHFQKPQAGSGAPMATGQPPAQPGTIRVRHKASGQTGTLPEAEFDPAQYDRL